MMRNSAAPPRNHIDGKIAVVTSAGIGMGADRADHGRL